MRDIIQTIKPVILGIAIVAGLLIQTGQAEADRTLAGNQCPHAMTDHTG